MIDYSENNVVKKGHSFAHSFSPQRSACSLVHDLLHSASLRSLRSLVGTSDTTMQRSFLRTPFSASSIIVEREENSSESLLRANRNGDRDDCVAIASNSKLI